MIYIAFFLFGLCFGSFANVIIDRIERGEEISGRSKCDFCGYQLRWFDNIPIISFLIIKAKCRKCGGKLSWQYPAVELFTGAVFAMTAWRIEDLIFSGNFWQLALGALFLLTAFLFVLVAVWDLKYMIIPNELVVAGVVVSGMILAAESFFPGGAGFGFDHVWISGALGAIAMAGFFGILYAVSKGRWIGGGDVKLAIWLGLLVGIKMVYPALMTAYLVGATVAVGLLIFGKKGMKSQVPFGPFMILGAYVTIFFREYMEMVVAFLLK